MCYICDEWHVDQTHTNRAGLEVRHLLLEERFLEENRFFGGMESQADFPERQEDFMSWLMTVLAISAVVQFSAAVLALLQFRQTGRIGAWILLAVAFCLMGCRHLLTLTAISGGTAGVALQSEVVAFLASLFVLAGVWLDPGRFCAPEPASCQRGGVG